MAWIRALWAGVAVLAIVVTAALARSTVSHMSCGKTGELSVRGASPDATCADSIAAVFGPGLLILLGLLLVAPPLAAAVLFRPVVSWLAVVAYFALGVVGVMHWTDFWGHLMAALVLGVMGFAVALLHGLLSWGTSVDVDAKSAAA